MAPQFIIIIFLFLLLLFTSYSSSRRILHQPFFPVADSTPQPPSSSPQPQPQPQPQPKYPFSSLTPPAPPIHHHHNHRFFPFYNPPPTTTTVPSTSLPTFPANISSIVIPSSSSSSSSSKTHFSKKLLLLSLTLTLLSIAVIAAVLASLLYHRNHNIKPPTSDSLRLFPANLPTSDKPPPPPTLPLNFSTPSSEFLYLGTLVSPLHDHKPQISNTHAASSTTLGYNRLGSPELHPLPPLPRQDFHHQHNLQDEDFFSDSKESPVAFQHQVNSPPPPPPHPPPPPPPTGFCDIERREEILKPKLKSLHWDKVRASSEKAMVWDRLKFSSFQLNEEMIETLFMANSSKLAPNHRTNRPMVEPMVAADMNQKNRVLDPHRSRNIAILLRAFNLTIDEVCESISQGNVDTLGSELLGSLLKMAPTMEEEVRLKGFDHSLLAELDPAEKFLKSVIGIPFAFKRIDAMLYISNFDTEIEYLKGSFEIIETACRELRNNRMFIKLLEAVLMAGNRMNTGTNRGDARAFKLDTLLKLVDVKGTDGKTTLLHFVVHEITKAEGCRLAGADLDFVGNVKPQPELHDEIEFTKRGLEVVSSLGGELSSVKKAATMDFDLLSKEVGRLAMGIPKIRKVVSLNEKTGSNKRFSDSMNMFLKRAEHDMDKIEAEEQLSFSMVKETTEYFHGNSSMDEAQPLRIFMVVREFLSVLDRVCKEVGKINERTTVRRSCGRDFPLPLSTGQKLPSVFRKLDER